MCERTAPKTRRRPPAQRPVEASGAKLTGAARKSEAVPRRRPPLKAKQAQLSSWLLSRPFTGSFIEDAESGTARMTRANTMVNRESRPVEKDDPNDEKPVSEPSTTGSDTSGSTEGEEDGPSDSRERLPVRFADHAAVFAPGEPPTMQRVRSHPEPSEAFRRRTAKYAKKSSQALSDPRQPTSAGGRWLLRKMSQ